MTSSAHQVAIIGGGISGLSTAFAIQEECQRTGLEIDCTVIEGSARFGGKIYTNHIDDFVIEAGPDSFLTTKPWAFELCEKLGITDQIINTNSSNSQTFCFAKGQMRELPQGLVGFVPTRVSALFSGGLISPLGMFRMGWEWFVPRDNDVERDESLAAFFRRRLGTEAFDYFIEPLVAGIYAGDANELSLKATFPRFYELEQQYGSLIKGMRAQQASRKPATSIAAPKRSMFATLQGGLGDLVEALVKRIESGGANLQIGHHVLEVNPVIGPSTGYSLVLDNRTQIMADDVVFATPAYVTSHLLKSHYPRVSELLARIPYSSTATISLAFHTKDVKSFIKGFGFVVPRIEGKAFIAATWTSLKWSNRSKPDQTLIRCYVGGIGREQILEEDDSSLVSYIRGQLKEMVGISHEPIFTEIHRWNRAMPQYICGHGQRLQEIRSLAEEIEGLHLTGAAFDGLGIPDCIREGIRVGTEIVQSNG
ncbi:MAG: protoporphyrinogen oxidase [Nitrospirales bacterium]